MADKAHDRNIIRDLIEGQGVIPDIPPKANRRGEAAFPIYCTELATRDEPSPQWESRPVPEMAIRFEMGFGMPADTMLRMQTAFDLANARANADEIKVDVEFA